MKNSMVLGVVFLFIVSFINPMVIGNKTSRDINYEEEYYFDKMFFNNNQTNCLDIEKITYVKQFSSTEIENKNNINKKTSLSISQGLMDSAWPMKCHDNRHTGRSPYSTAGNPDGVEKWRFHTDHWIEQGPVIDNDGIVYFADGYGYIFALYTNGTVKWQFETSGGILCSTPAIAEDGTIYVGDWDYFLYAITPNGTEKWRFPSGGTIATSPAIAEDGTIYFGTFSEGFFALNPNGTLKWNYHPGADVLSDPAIGDDGTIYFGCWNNNFYALYPNGTLKWSFPTGGIIKGPASIAEDGTIYFGSYDDYLYALYPDGTEKWHYPIGTGTETNPTIGSDGTIYVGDDRLYAIYPNGTLKWAFYLGPDTRIHRSSPAICDDGSIYVGTLIGNDAGGEIVAVNPDGTELWSKRIADLRVQSSPSIGEDGTVYIGSSYDMGSGYLHAFGIGSLIVDANGPYNALINEDIQFISTIWGGIPPYEYSWDFGDGNTSDEENPVHSYSEQGDYFVNLTVTDSENNISTDTTMAYIRSPPYAPEVNGPSSGYFGEEYDYNFTTIDPDDDDIWLYIEWGDNSNTGWIGPYNSGEQVVVSHTWSEEGTYTIRAKAKDIFDDESDWGTLEVTMPVNQQESEEHPLLSWWLERFPLLYQILSCVLEELNI